MYMEYTPSYAEKQIEQESGFRFKNPTQPQIA